MPRFIRMNRQCVIEILTRRIAVDFDRHSSLRGGCKYRIPVGHDAGTRPGDPATRVRQNPDCRAGDRSQHTVGLIVIFSQPRMRRRQYDVEGCRFIDE